MARQLRDMPPETQKPLLRVLHGRASLVPWSAIHPSWLEDVFKGWRPQWRLWALDSLPTELRVPLQQDLHAPAASFRPGQAPRWWNAWFPVHVKSRLAYPDLPPWERAAGAAGLPGILWEREEKELTRLLAFHGTRGFVSALRALPRPEAQHWMWQLPPQCQPVAQETVASRVWLEDPFWPAIFRELEAVEDVAMRLFRMALADLVRCGLQQDQEPHLRRLAYRLPRRWGAWLLEQIEELPEWTTLEPQPSLEAWKQDLWGVLEPAEAETR
jgi:hypothetical protein